MTRYPSVGRVIALALCGAGVGAASWVLGLDAFFAVALGVLLAALGVAWGALAGTPAPLWADEPEARPAGARDDVARLAWPLRSRRGQVQESAYKRMRALARARLARHGVNLDGEGGLAAAGALIGPAACRALHAPGGRLPSLGAIEACLDALERLDGAAGAGPPVPVRRMNRARGAARTVFAPFRRRESGGPHDR